MIATPFDYNCKSRFCLLVDLGNVLRVVVQDVKTPLNLKESFSHVFILKKDISHESLDGFQ
jgi:hypothetical protein